MKKMLVCLLCVMLLAFISASAETETSSDDVSPAVQFIADYLIIWELAEDESFDYDSISNADGIFILDNLFVINIDEENYGVFLIVNPNKLNQLTYVVEAMSNGLDVTGNYIVDDEDSVLSESSEFVSTLVDEKSNGNLDPMEYNGKMYQFYSRDGALILMCGNNTATITLVQMVIDAISKA